jgi:hypothetical protein
MGGLRVQYQPITLTLAGYAQGRNRARKTRVRPRKGRARRRAKPSPRASFAPELGVRELPAIVLQPHEGRASVLERGEAGEARPDLPAERIGEHGQEEEHSGRQEEVGGPDVALTLARPHGIGGRAGRPRPSVPSGARSASHITVSRELT